MQLNKKDMTITLTNCQEKQTKLVRREVRPGSLHDHHIRMLINGGPKVYNRVVTIVTTSNPENCLGTTFHNCDWNQYHVGTTLLSPGMQLERFIGALAPPLVM